MPRVFLSLYADSHEAAIEFYCHTIGLFAVALDHQLAPTVRNVILNYTAAQIPLSLAVLLTPGNKSAEPVRHVFSLTLFCPDIDGARKRLTSAGFAVEMSYVPLGTVLKLEDPFGNTLYLTDDSYHCYDDEE